jgi:hypothetical protein
MMGLPSYMLQMVLLMQFTNGYGINAKYAVNREMAF